MTHLITMDLHQKEIQGFFDVPVDNLRASPFLINYIENKVKDELKRKASYRKKKKPKTFKQFLYWFSQTQKIPDYRNAIIVARNPGQAKRATAIAERLRLGIAVIHGCETEKEADNENADKTCSNNIKGFLLSSKN